MPLGFLRILKRLIGGKIAYQTLFGYVVFAHYGDCVYVFSLHVPKDCSSVVSNAFTLQERNHESGKIMVAGTSCRMVSFATFENELHKNNFKILEQGVTSALPDFNNLMYAVIKK